MKEGTMSGTRSGRASRSSSRIVREGAAALAFAAVLVVGVASGAHAAPASSPDAQLLRKHQPVLVFHPDEQFRPTKVQSFVEDSELERFVGTSLAELVLDAAWAVVDPDPEPGELPGPMPGVFYRLDQAGCEADAPLAGRDCYTAAWSEGGGGDAVYGRVVRTDDRIVLQYWLFYYHNPLLLPPTPFGVFWQSHEGDWEVVNVILDADETPLEAAYSQHCTGQRKAWADVEKSPAGGTHPVAYVALGSHANFFAPGAGPLGAIPINPACIPAGVPAFPFLVDQVLDGSAAGGVVGPPGSGVDGATIHRIEGTAWSVFGGRWGESEYFFTPVAIPPVPANTAVPVGLAPASPANQANWNPATILGWPTG
jgi:hypothetical protein